MAVRVTLECGHESILRERTTPLGYTHDWEVFVRGVDNADIRQYIDKVVFFLHETFPKRKRVLKEPPYVVKESGYAGFIIPIHIYFKNKDELKKLEILYDLQLQQSGPAINNVTRHSQVFPNPSDDFKRKLLKGGAVIVSSSEGAPEKGELKIPPQMVGKPKLSGSEGKKHRPAEENTFTKLFGTPIKASKASPDSKKVVPPEKPANPKPLLPVEKSEKTEKTLKIKHSPHKEGKKEKGGDEKKERKDKEYAKEKDKVREKSKKPQSPGCKNSHSSPGTKRVSSPLPPKKSSSPPPPPVAKRHPSPKAKEKEIKKPLHEKDKDKEKDKLKTVSDESKGERKKEKKKHKEDKDKERKEKHKEREKDKVRETSRSVEKVNDRVEVNKLEKMEKADKTERPDKTEKDKSQDSKPVKEDRKSPKLPKESDKPKDDKLSKLERLEKPGKTKDGKGDKERQKHKHKKRDKKDRRDGSREREKKEKRDKSKVAIENENNLPTQQSATPLETLVAEMADRDSSDSAPSPDDDSLSEVKPVPTIKKETESLSAPPVEVGQPLSPPPDIKKERNERSKREKSKGSKAEERENKKRKRRSESKADEEPVLKREKERGPSSSPPLEPVSSSQSPVAVDAEPLPITKVKEERALQGGQIATIVVKGSEGEGEQVAPDSTNNTLAEPEIGEPPVFSDDYVSQLKDLQHKIMTLQDNQELQRVVQVIAETGQYEITNRTFDFDLCALDRRTVQRLQRLFSVS